MTPILRVAVAGGLMFGAVALLPSAAAAQFAEEKVLTLEIARKIVTAAEAEAARNHLAGGRRQKFNVWVLDIYSFCATFLVISS
jgi:hypothetical protein